MDGKEHEADTVQETKSKASLYQLIEELVLSEHARYLEEECGVELIDKTDPVKK